MSPQRREIMDSLTAALKKNIRHASRKKRHTGLLSYSSISKNLKRLRAGLRDKWAQFVDWLFIDIGGMGPGPA